VQKSVQEFERKGVRASRMEVRVASRGFRVPIWEELIPTPRVFGKSAEGIEGKALEGKNVVYGK